MNSQNELSVVTDIQTRRTWTASLASMFPYISPEFVPVLLMFAIAGFFLQIFKAVSVSGWYGVVSDPFSVFWSFVWFVACCGIYTKIIAPHLERSHPKLGTFIHASCIYSFFAGTLVCLQIVIRTFH